MMSKYFGTKKPINNFFTLTHKLIFSMIFFLIISGCAGIGKISQEQAIQIALNDTKTLNLIDNHSYEVKDVSVAHLSIGSGGPVEVYSVTIDVLNETHIRVITFVAYDGKVVSVGTSFPPAQPPASLLNETSPS